MIGLLMTLAVIAAVAVVGWRRWEKSRWQRRQPGASIDQPLVVSRFDEIDATIAERRCWCGGAFAESGETSRNIGEQRFRVVRLVCKECERELLMYFDVTAVFH
ncbi:MAG TPA: hypothetical protein VMT89_14945 [Candidatus Acidoferrales bacterium]|nr:hypothetical protein [Candidatus Acidoferrales bacterium]